LGVGLLNPNKLIIPVLLFSPVVRPIIGLAQLNYTAALKAFYYGQRTRVRNEFSSLVVGWLMSRYGNRTQDLWIVLLGFNTKLSWLGVGLLKPNKTIIPVLLFSPIARPIIGLAQLNCTAALQPRRYALG